MSDEADQAVRLAAFHHLDRLRTIYGDSLTRAVLAEGFLYHGSRVPLLGPQGIFKPAVLDEVPLSITTVPLVAGKARPYEDDVSRDGDILYRYRGKDPGHPDNRGLRRAMELQVPLIHFEGLGPRGAATHKTSRPHGRRHARGGRVSPVD